MNGARIGWMAGLAWLFHAVHVLESHHANLAGREGARSRMGCEGQVRPCWPQREPFARLAPAPRSPADIGPFSCSILWGGATIIPERAGQGGYPRAKWEIPADILTWGRGALRPP